MPRRSRIYLALYFNLERTEDLDLLTLLYALPPLGEGQRSSRSSDAHLAAIWTRITRTAPRSIARPCGISSPREPGPDVGDAGAEPAQAVARAPAHPRSRSPRSVPPRTTGQGLDELTDDAARAPSGNAEIRLDRLLRSFLR